MKCIIVDDEPLAIKVLATHLANIPDMEVVATCTNALEAFDRLSTTPIDVLFLDIQMPELTGVELVKSLEKPPSVIFTTAHRDYAIEGFELDAVDYLLKPISLPRLLRAINKVRRLDQVSHNDLGHEHAYGAQNQQTINVRADRETIVVNVDDIGFIESLGDYVTIHLPHRKVTTKKTISQLEEELGGNRFLRIHRSYLVPVSGISGYTSEYVRVAERELPIGRTYRREVMRRLEAK